MSYRVIGPLVTTGRIAETLKSRYCSVILQRRPGQPDARAFTVILRDFYSLSTSSTFTLLLLSERIFCFI